MTKKLLLDQVSARDLYKTGLLHNMSQSGIVCCTTAVAFENPAQMSRIKQQYDAGGNIMHELEFDTKSEQILELVYQKYGLTERITFSDAAALALACAGNYVMIATEPVIYEVARELQIEVWGYDNLLELMVRKQVFNQSVAAEYLVQLLVDVNHAAVITGPGKQVFDNKPTLSQRDRIKHYKHRINRSREHNMI